MTARMRRRKVFSEQQHDSIQILAKPTAGSEWCCKNSENILTPKTNSGARSRLILRIQSPISISIARHATQAQINNESPGPTPARRPPALSRRPHRPNHSSVRNKKRNQQRPPGRQCPLRHRPGRTLPGTSTTAPAPHELHRGNCPSRGAAQEYSPGRKPWGNAPTRPAPEGRKTLDTPSRAARCNRETHVCRSPPICAKP